LGELGESGNNSNSNSNGNRRSFDSPFEKCANGFAQDDTFWVGAGEQKAEAAELAALALMLG